MALFRRRQAATQIPSLEEFGYEDNRDLVKAVVEYPHLDPDSPADCPVREQELLAYLAIEVPDGELLTGADLNFVRTSQVAESRYWLWRFNEPRGDDAFLTVSQGPEGATTTGYSDNYLNLSPEQFILGDFHECF